MPSFASKPLFSESKNIELFYSNSRSIKRKTHLLSFIKSLGYHVILLSETWLTSDDADAFLMGSLGDYVAFRKDRITNAEITRGGGVAILCSPLLNPILFATFSSDGIECLVIDIHFPSNRKTLSSIRICLIYRSPSYLGVTMQSSLKFNDHISRIVSKARAKLSLPTLEHRRLISDLLFLHRSIHGFYSYDHTNLFKLSPLGRNLRRSHPLRIGLPYALPKSHSTFATRIIDRWNVLPADFVNSSPIFFRSHLLSLPSISFTSDSLLRL
ncbi:hypothetical protein PRIPAC_95451 [Pristionchus pacificus]|uniref:Endonuclease/exonuclease/phosphatase domain-containing protein n=1 Tax=Pristionchus pacificus TaxID=54126 RepID=A0A2A6BCH6_PRIPA|nr:hypothetical protein PRIPAC_95451 [Pristionchus pacificus]|eukprot:PDM63564.1 hypothetical protein PRIPAC_49537 [Pristionchus pacificus]